MNSAVLSLIPRELWQEIHKFLKELEFWEVLSTSKELFHQTDLSKTTRNIFLTEKLYLSYLANVNLLEVTSVTIADYFFKEISRRIECFSNQLMIHSPSYSISAEKYPTLSFSKFLLAFFQQQQQQQQLQSIQLSEEAENNKHSFHELRWHYQYQEADLQILANLPQHQPFIIPCLELSSILMEHFSNNPSKNNAVDTEIYKTLHGKIISKTFKVCKFSDLKSLSEFSLAPITYSQLLQECELTDCPYLMDISPLTGCCCRKVILQRCTFLVNINPLKNVKVLEMKDCPKIVDISELRNHSLTILRCSSLLYEMESPVSNSRFQEALAFPRHLSTDLITHSKNSLKFFSINLLSLALFEYTTKNFQMVDYSCLKRLSLTCCEITSLHFVSSCISLAQLKLYSLLHIKSLDGIEQVSWIRIIDCRSLVDISALRRGGNTRKSVSIEKCQLIKDFSPLRNIYKLQIIHCTNFQELSNSIANVKHLSLKDLPILKLPSATSLILSGLEKLELVTCPEITDIDCLSSIRDLTIMRCIGIRSYAPLVNNERIYLSFIEKLDKWKEDCLPSVTRYRCVKVNRMKNTFFTQVDALYLVKRQFEK